MSLQINNRCIACDACLDVCPHKAIVQGEIYIINEKYCDECKHAKPKCVRVCPANAITKRISNGKNNSSH